MSDQIHVEVVYALQNRQKAVMVQLSSGATVRDAVERSGLITEFPEIDLAVNKFGIWNKLAKADTLLRDKDRVEIYRPLIADPKEVRRQRAAEGKVMKKGGGDAEAG
jgi:putative ubiquitin-RnfH superfamily antitoxin RatB of RatAB toxin-antitoxin module